MLVGELMARLGLDRTEFNKGLADAQADGAARGQLIGGALKGAMVAGLAGLAVVVGAALKTAFDAASDNRQAINNLQASLGVTREEAERLSKEGQQLWTNGFGGNLVEANERISSVRQNIKGLADEDLAEVAAGNSAIAESFGEEGGRVDAAVNSLMTNMGLSYQQAQDFITAGFQRGLNASGDFLDSITEYGPQFAELGASGDAMFSALETGFQNGVLGTDKVADLFKETRLRISEDTPATRDALTALGIDANTFYQGLRDGSLSGVEAFAQIQQGLRDTQDPITQNMAAVALMGTQWEDLGASTILGIDLQQTSLASLAGATDGLNVKYDSLGAMGEALWRRTQVALIPVGDAMIELANAVMPHVFAAFTWLETNVPPAIGAIERGFAIAIKAAQPVISQVQSVVAAFGRGGDASNQFSGILAFLGETWTKVATIIKLAAELVGVAIRDGLTFLSGTALPALQSAWTNLQPVVSAALGLFQQVAGGSGELGGELAVLGEVWRALQRLILALIPPIRDIVLTVFGVIQTFLRQHGDEIAAFLKSAWERIGTVVRLVIEVLQATIIPIFTGIAGFLRSHSTEIGTVLSAAWTLIQSVITIALAVIEGVIRTTLAIIRGDWQGAWDAMRTMLVTVWDAIKTYLAAAVEGIKTLLSLAWDAIKGTASSAWNSLWSSSIQPAVNTIKSGVTGVIDSLKRDLDTAWSTIKSGAESAWRGIASGIASAFSSAVGGIKGVLNDMIGKVNDAIEGFNKLPGPNIPKIPKLAQGTSFFAGGIALVGEEGPELVALPRGSQVAPARQTKDMLAGSGGVTNIYYPNATFVNADVDQASLNGSVALLQMLGSGT